MDVLRLSLAACKLTYGLAVDGLCSALILTTRGIIVGGVHVTNELRPLIVQWMDEVVASVS